MVSSVSPVVRSISPHAETTVAVSFSECGGGMVVDEVDADLLAVLHRAIPATKGHTRRLATLGIPEIHRDAAVFVLELLDRIERGSSGEE